MGGFAGALTKFEEAAATGATDRAVQRNLALTKARLAWVRLERGESDEAVRASGGGHRLQPREGAVLLGLGVAHLYRGDERKAEVLLQRALEADPTQILAHKLLGEIAYRRDDLQAARPRFESALRLDPSDVAVRAGLGPLLAEAGAPEHGRRLGRPPLTRRCPGGQGQGPAPGGPARLGAARQGSARR